MAVKSGASHASAAFLSILLGTVFKKVLDLHASLITDLSTQFGSVVSVVPGISLSDDVAGFLAISTVLAFLWGVVYHNTRHGSTSEGPKNYNQDDQSTKRARQMEARTEESAAASGGFGQPNAASYRSVSTTKETEEHLRSRLERDIADVKTRLDDVHDRLYDADQRDLLESVTGLQDSITQIEANLRRAVIVGANRTGGASDDDFIDDQRQETLVDSHTDLLDTSDELLSIVRDVHHAPADQLDREVFQSCEELVSDLEKAIGRRKDILDTTGERA